MIAGSAFSATIFLSGIGYFRHVNIFYPEIIQATVAFQDINETIKIIGLKGNLGINPVLIARTDSQYLLTVTNQGSKEHQFYIDGLNLDTKVLSPNESDIITVKEFKTGDYHYYDVSMGKKKQLGIFKVVHVGGI